MSDTLKAGETPVSKVKILKKKKTSTGAETWTSNVWDASVVFRRDEHDKWLLMVKVFYRFDGQWMLFATTYVKDLYEVETVAREWLLNQTFVEYHYQREQ
jgi:hypothetical protein